MCNIAGYVGKRDAASVLIDMTLKQEGLYGGFFTGLAVHNGVTQEYRKVEGDLARLLASTDARFLRGTTGIMHSRSPAGGDGTWAHPFISERDGAVQLSYVANGGAGAFRPQNESYNSIADALIRDGFDIPCKLKLEKKKYNQLSTGESVHMSDVMCQLIYKHVVSGEDTALAMNSAFGDMPGEIVGLALDTRTPDRIYYSRINQPMFVGFDDSGAYLCSSPLGFPESVVKYELLPILSSGVVFADRYEVVAHHDFPIGVVPFDDKTLSDVELLILSMLEKGDAGIPDMHAAVDDMLKCDSLVQTAVIIYILIMRLLEEKKIEAFASVRIKNGKSAPQTRFKLATRLI